MSDAPAPQAKRYFLDPIACRHREESRRMILRAADMVAPRTAAILGGGACEEIPLEELLERFDSVTLNDMDSTAIEKAVNALPPDAALRKKLNIEVADLSGVTRRALDRVEQVLRATDDMRQAIDRMVGALDELTPGDFPVTGQYDLVVCSCVLSQLHFSLTHEAIARFAHRFPGQDEQLRDSDVWKASLERAARRMEDCFVESLATIVTDGGLVYLSESAQVCFLQLTPDRKWETPGTYRMLRTKELADYVSERFEVVGRNRWEWVVAPPQIPTDTGLLFDVQALVLKRAVQNHTTP